MAVAPGWPRCSAFTRLLGCSLRWQVSLTASTRWPRLTFPVLAIVLSPHYCASRIRIFPSLCFLFAQISGIYVFCLFLRCCRLFEWLRHDALAVSRWVIPSKRKDFVNWSQATTGTIHSNFITAQPGTVNTMITVKLVIVTWTNSTSCRRWWRFLVPVQQNEKQPVSLLPFFVLVVDYLMSPIVPQEYYLLSVLYLKISVRKPLQTKRPVLKLVRESTRRLPKSWKERPNI